MPETFRTASLPSKAEAGVVVIHCSGPRYQPHFQDFLRRGLGLDRYALIAVPGGAQLLTLADYFPKFAWAGWRFWPGGEGLRARQVKDLDQVRAALAERFPATRVEIYYARLENGQASFEAL